MHRVTDEYWRRYHDLPRDVRVCADKCFRLLLSDSRHPSLQFKKVGRFWSARVGAAHRALAVPDGDDYIWVWIGSHGEYDRILLSR